MKFEAVGSFLPSIELIEAREAYKENKIDNDTFCRIENDAVRAIADRQIEAGLATVTSGELRRNIWDDDFYFGLGGICRERQECGHIYDDVAPFTDLYRISGKIEYNPLHPFFDDFLFLQDYVGGRAKCRQTIPSPADLYLELLQLTDGMLERIYPDRELLKKDISEAYSKTILHFYDLGCRDIQIDDTSCGHLCDPVYIQRFMLAGIDILRLHEDVIGIINDSVKDVPADMSVSIYLSSGSNLVPKWNVKATVDNIMPKALARLDVGTFFLPFTPGSTEATAILDFVPVTKKVVLGLVSAHCPYPDDNEKILATVRSAEKHFPAERLAMSPAGGFKLSSFMEKGIVYDDQWRKLEELSHLASAL